MRKKLTLPAAQQLLEGEPGVLLAEREIRTTEATEHTEEYSSESPGSTFIWQTFSASKSAGRHDYYSRVLLFQFRVLRLFRGQPS